MTKKLASAQIATFQDEVRTFYIANKRSMPWRENPTPYFVVVSELMLQQTQVDRVRPKFTSFIKKFPDFKTLAAASQSEVISAWVGLGYNRRAKFLHGIAKDIQTTYDGKLPNTAAELVTLPGIGPNTAGAIMAYVFNEPVVFVETNIRSVVLHHFFAGETEVSESAILEVAKATTDHTNPREWYWALMDYGTYIKKTYGNNISRAKQYHRQSAFQGSLRQVRGQVIRQLTTGAVDIAKLQEIITDTRLAEVLAALHAEKLITLHHNRVQLAE